MPTRKPSCGPERTGPPAGVPGEPGRASSSSVSSFPWASSRTLRFTPQGEYPIAFPPECPMRVQFLLFTRDHRVAPSYHDYLEFSFVCDGHGRFGVENRSYPAAPGDFLLVGSREFHRLTADREGGLRVASVHFRPELVHAPGESALGFEYLKPFYYRGADYSHRLAGADLPVGFVLDRIGRIHREIQAAEPDYPLAVRTCLADLLFEVSRAYRRAGIALVPRGQRARDFERLLDVLSHVRKNCHERQPLPRLAAMAHMSPGHFCRFFKTTTGSTLTDYLLRLRVDLAADFLANSALSVTDIAYASGFSSHSYFDRVFKRLKGVTPLDYRRQLKL